jgi:signal transduction histidine kinase
MRLTLKLVLVFMLGNIVLAALYGYLAVQHEIRAFERTVESEAQLLGPPLEDVLVESWRRAGYERVTEVIRKANVGQDSEMCIRWVWFDTQSGNPDAPAAAPEVLTAIVIQQHRMVESAHADGVEYLHVYWPVSLTRDRRGGLEFAHKMTALENNERDVIRRTALLIGGMVLLSGLLAVLLGVRFVGAPLRQIIEKTRRIATGDLHRPLHLHTHDELAELAADLNAMCAKLAQSQQEIRAETAARLATMEQLRHADRLKTVGRLAAGIAHELGTPLNVVSGRAGLILSGKLASPEVDQSAAAIKAEADKMTRIIRQLLDFARASAPHKAAVDLRQLVGQTMDLLHALAEKNQVQLCFDRTDEPATTEVDVGQIQQVLTNLLVNAIQAMPHGGQVEIAVRRQSACPPEEVGGLAAPYFGIEIQDHGVGISAEHLPQLFEPFFTTKQVGEGTGLGLSIAYGIVQEHGGWIAVDSQPGQGSRFTVMLPEVRPS